MRFKIYALFILVAIFNLPQIHSQNTFKNVSKLASEDFDNYFDEQVLSYWEKAKAMAIV